MIERNNHHRVAHGYAIKKSFMYRNSSVNKRISAHHPIDHHLVNSMHEENDPMRMSKLEQKHFEW